MKLVVSVFFLLIFFAFDDVFADEKCSKTPLTIRKDFISNCRDLKLGLIRCLVAWFAFKGAFSGRDPATVASEHYQPYFIVLPIEAKEDQSLFWSGTYSIVEVVSTQPNPAGAVVYSSTNEPSSAIINDLGYGVNWCGIKGGGIDYVNECLCSVSGNFWERFSVDFAKASRGSAYWLGDGERDGGAFSNSSYFSTVELPNMNADEVVAIVVHKQGKRESCSEGSMNVLRSRVIERSIEYDCYDVYGDINETNTIAACVSIIISGIQEGMRPKDHEVECGPSITA